MTTRVSMSQSDFDKIKDLLLKTLTSQPLHWNDIMAAVSKEMKIKNWLKVRVVLQSLENVKRTDNLMKEEYFVEASTTLP